MQDTDLPSYHSLNWPTDDTSTVGGGINSSSLIVNGITGSLFPSAAIPVTGSANLVHRYKMFKKNTHGSETALTPKYWIYNGLKANTQGPVTIVTYATETGIVRVAGYAAGVPTYEDITVTGAAGSYVGVVNWDAGEIWWAEALSVGGSSRRAVNGKHEIWRGTSLGMIPGPLSTGTENFAFATATAEYDLGLDPTINGTLAATNRLTNPTGVTFTRPITQAEAASGGNLAPGDAQGIWLRRTVRAGLIRPKGVVEPSILMSAEV